MQSPIQIVEPIITRNYTPFHFTGYNHPFNAQITYTEHAISVKFSNPSHLPSVCGAGLFKEYILTALDFHWDSEHRIKDHTYPLEAQLIHYAKIYDNFENALNYKDGIAILSTFYELSDTPNDSVENLLETIPSAKLKLEQPVELLQPIIPRHFLTPKVCKFYRYNGSLTTPCLNETVTWTIFSNPLHISQLQLDRLKKNWTALNKSKTKNCREVQEIYDRRIYLSAI